MIRPPNLTRDHLDAPTAPSVTRTADTIAALETLVAIPEEEIWLEPWPEVPESAGGPRGTRGRGSVALPAGVTKGGRPDITNGEGGTKAW